MKRTITRTVAIPLILISALACGLLIGCSGDNDPLVPVAESVNPELANPELVNPESYNNVGTFQLTLIDSPVDFDEFILVLRGISAHRASEDSLDGWYRMEIEPEEYDLLELVNGVSDLIADAELPEGTYNQIRLLLGEGNHVVIDGEKFDLIIPSGLSSGIKIHHVFEIVKGQEYRATLDFDAARSVKVDGRGRYRLKPVLRVQENDSAGNIIGSVTPPEAEVLIWTVAGADTVSAFADMETGEFMLSTLPAGNYILTLTPKGYGPYSEVNMPGVEVIAGDTTDVGEILVMIPVK